MRDEQLFRIIALAVVLLGAAVGVYHRIRAAREGTPVSRSEEPWPLRVLLRLCALIGGSILVAWMISPRSVGWAVIPLAAWARWLGAAMALAAVPLVAWTFHTLGRNLTDTVATRANSYLVTSGPYRWVRHPFYVTVTLFGAGLSLLTALWPTALLLAVVLLLLALRTPLEERKLVERFGDAYRDYAARTGRFVPRRMRKTGSDAPAR